MLPPNDGWKTRLGFVIFSRINFVIGISCYKHYLKKATNEKYQNLYTISTNGMSKVYLHCFPIGWLREYVYIISFWWLWTLNIKKSVNNYNTIKILSQRSSKQKSCWFFRMLHKLTPKNNHFGGEENIFLKGIWPKHINT